jgi:hypothetical protein
LQFARSCGQAVTGSQNGVDRIDQGKARHDDAQKDGASGAANQACKTVERPDQDKQREHETERSAKVHPALHGRAESSPQEIAYAARRKDHSNNQERDVVLPRNGVDGQHAAAKHQVELATQEREL